MQGVGGRIGGLKRCLVLWSRTGCLDGSTKRGASVLGFMGGARVFSQSSAAVSAPSSSLEKEEVSTRITHLLKSIPFIDPSKVSPTASFKNDLQLDMLDNVELMMAVEEEFAVVIPDNEANKISTAAHLIDYISTHPQAKSELEMFAGEVLISMGYVLMPVMFITGFVIIFLWAF